MRVTPVAAFLGAQGKNYYQTVVVFSNWKPDVGQMSKDRWKIFQIQDEDLLDATEKYI